MSAFVLTYTPVLNGKAVDRQRILDILNSTPEVYDWRAAVGAVFIVSDLSPTKLSEIIRSEIPGLFHIIIPIDGAESADGWADQGTWDFLNRICSR